MNDQAGFSEVASDTPRPFYCELKANRPIAWCRCGRSKRQPYCDGRSHIGSGFEPLLYRASNQDEEVLLCGCKHTRTPPFCDGSHNNLPGGYSGDTRTDEDRARIPRSQPDSNGIRRLDGTCYVVSPAVTKAPDAGTFWPRKIIAPSLGAQHQSQFYLEVAERPSPVLSAGLATVVLFVARGSGRVEICGRHFDVKEGDGLHVRPGEAFRISPAEGLAVYASALPAVEELREIDAMPLNFDEREPVRVRGIDAAQKSEMGPRYFQLLIDKSVGLTGAAQFIGHIPPSRAEMHRHLYEEALIILSGEGIMWNDKSCTSVGPGDVIFLPRKQAHSLECTDPAGMEVVGVIHPGDNPAINY